MVRTGETPTKKRGILLEDGTEAPAKRICQENHTALLRRLQDVANDRGSHWACTALPSLTVSSLDQGMRETALGPGRILLRPSTQPQALLKLFTRQVTPPQPCLENTPLSQLWTLQQVFTALLCSSQCPQPVFMVPDRSRSLSTEPCTEVPTVTSVRVPH